MASPENLPILLSARVLASPDRENHGFRIKQGEEGAILIYHIEPGSAAAESDLCVGCEILSINDHRVASAEKCIEMLVYYLDRKGMADIVASKGGRPLGTRYVLVKNTQDKSIFDGGSSVIDGLPVEQKKGYVRIVDYPKNGFFSKVRLHPGDCIWSIDGKIVQDIDEIRHELKLSEGKIVFVLTYNSFRKLKSAVMTVSTKLNIADKWQLAVAGAGGEAKESSRLEDVYNIHEKVRMPIVTNLSSYSYNRSFITTCYQLGEGAFAVVKRATHKQTGNVYAIKTVNRASLGSGTEIALKEEIGILTDLNHEHIMNIHGVYVTIGEYHLVTEYLEGGELFDRIVDKSSYTESEARDVCKILFGALAFMEKKRIAHRDLKPENLLLQYKHSDSEIKIADFGFAKKAETEESLSTICGTPGYVGPEVLCRKKYGTKCDMWSMGVIVYILLGGYPPFYADNEKELFRLTRMGDFEFHEEHWGNVSAGAKDLITSLLQTNPKKRASAEEVLASPWINADRKLLRRNSLADSQVALRRHVAKTRFKKAIASVIFVQGFTGEHAVFSGKKKKVLNVED